MHGEPDELLRVVELGNRRYQIRRGDLPHRISVYWEIGSTEKGSFSWAPAWGVYLPREPAWHEAELTRHITELRHADAQARAEARRQR